MGKNIDDKRKEKLKRRRKEKKEVIQAKNKGV